MGAWIAAQILSSAANWQRHHLVQKLTPHDDADYAAPWHSKIELDYISWPCGRSWWWPFLTASFDLAQWHLFEIYAGQHQLLCSARYLEESYLPWLITFSTLDWLERQLTPPTTTSQDTMSLSSRSTQPAGLLWPSWQRSALFLQCLLDTLKPFGGPLDHVAQNLGCSTPFHRS